MMLRILAIIVLIFSVLVMPFWVSVILAFSFMAYFSFFLEAVFLFLLIDVLYGTPEIKLFGMIFAAFSVAVFGLIIIELAKRKLRLRTR